MKHPPKSPRAASPSSKSKRTPASGPVELTDEIRARIALKAYELYERRGRGDGHALDDWLEAERMVLAELRGSGS